MGVSSWPSTSRLTLEFNFSMGLERAPNELLGESRVSPRPEEKNILMYSFQLRHKAKRDFKKLYNEEPMLLVHCLC